MNDRKYVKVNTSIQTGSNADRLSYDSEGNVKAVIDLNLPADLFPEKNGPKKIDSVVMQTSKMRLSMENMPIAQIPIDEDLTKMHKTTVAEAQLDIFPYSFVEGKIDRSSNDALPYYKTHTIALKFRYYETPSSVPVELETVEFYANSKDYGFPVTNRFAPLVTKADLQSVYNHLMNLCVQDVREKMIIESGQLMLRNVSTLQQMLQDGLENAITYACTESSITLFIDLLDTGYIGNVSPPIPDPTNTVEVSEYSTTAVYWKYEEDTDHSSSTNGLLAAVKPQVTLDEQSLTISYDTAAFNGAVPILWNTSYIDTRETAKQLTLDALRKEVWSGEAPPKRKYQYGVNLSENGEYSFTLDDSVTCGLMNIIANRSLRNTMSFLPWIEIEQNAIGIEEGKRAPKYMNLEVNTLVMQNKTHEDWVYAHEDHVLPTTATRYTCAQAATDEVPYISVILLFVPNSGDGYRVYLDFAYWGSIEGSTTETNVSIETIYRRRDVFSAADLRGYRSYIHADFSDTPIESSTTANATSSGALEPDESWSSDYGTNFSYVPTFGTDEDVYSVGVPIEYFVSHILSHSTIVPLYYSGTSDTYTPQYQTAVLQEAVKYVPKYKPDIMQFGGSSEIPGSFKMQMIWNLYYIASASTATTAASYIRVYPNVYGVLHRTNQSVSAQNPSVTYFHTRQVKCAVPLENVDARGMVIKTSSIPYALYDPGWLEPRFTCQTTAPPAGTGPLAMSLTRFSPASGYDYVLVTYDFDVPEAYYSAHPGAWPDEGLRMNQRIYISQTDDGTVYAPYNSGALGKIEEGNLDYICEKLAQTKCAEGYSIVDDTFITTKTADLVSEDFDMDGSASISTSNPEYNTSFFTSANTTRTSASFLIGLTPEAMAWYRFDGEYYSGHILFHGTWLRPETGTIPTHAIPPSRFPPAASQVTIDGNYAHYHCEWAVERAVLPKYRTYVQVNRQDLGSDETRAMEAIAANPDKVFLKFDLNVQEELDDSYYPYVAKYLYEPNLSLTASDNNKFYVLDGSASEVTIGPQEPIYQSDGNYIGNQRISFRWNNLPMVVLSPISSIVLTLTGMDVQQEYQPVNMTEVGGSSLTSSIPVIENYFSLAQTLRDLHDELVVVKEQFDTTATYTLATQSGQERSLTISAQYISKDGRLHQIYIPPNGVFTLQLTFGISYYYSS